MFVKTCSKCKTSKKGEEFSRNKISKDGYQNQCKSCAKTYENSKNKISKTQAEHFVKLLSEKGEKYLCKCCEERKNASEFYYQRKRGSVKLVTSKCKSCQKDYQRSKTFGINPQQFSELLTKQDNKCAICKIDHEDYQKISHRGKKFAVDHCHSSGSIRGLLCDKCNRGIGFLQDNKQILTNAIKYLEGDDIV